MPCAIPLQISVVGTVRHDRFVHLDLPGIRSGESFLLCELTIDKQSPNKKLDPA
jgi:hypothetical protein